MTSPESEAATTGAEPRLPNFFVVGAPKCGTTSMMKYLDGHPQLHMVQRELSYFGGDFRIPSITDRDAYLAHFAGAPEASLVVGEKSPSYFASETAADDIRAFSPGARVLIMLRNPVDLVHSWHGHMRFSGYEDEPSLERALALEEPRAQGQNLPSLREASPAMFQYRRLATYPQHVQRYFDAFGRDRVMVVLLEEMQRDPQAAYLSLLAFLQLEAPSALPEFRAHNTRKKPRSEGLNRFLASPPPWLRQLARKLVPLDLKRRVVRRVNDANTQHQASELSPKLRAQLWRELSPSVRELEGMLDRALPWKG